MRIIENPNPTPTFVFTCDKCSCKFECTDNEIKHDSWNDAMGRIGGTHHWSQTSYINCPNCGEEIVISRQAGYGSSVIDDYHITEDYQIRQDNPDNTNNTIKKIINTK